MTTNRPTPTTQYVALRGIEHGNRFYTSWTPGKSTPEDIVKLADGTVAYEILGYAETIEQAQELTGHARMARLFA